MSSEKLSLPPDISGKVALDFPNGSQSSVLALLDEYGGPERVRVIRCVIHLAEGSPDKLLDLLGTARTDYRDVIYRAEYTGSDQRIHDFNHPFPATLTGPSEVS